MDVAVFLNKRFLFLKGIFIIPSDLLKDKADSLEVSKSIKPRNADYVLPKHKKCYSNEL